jgi:hypothetical protein
MMNQGPMDLIPASLVLSKRRQSLFTPPSDRCARALTWNFLGGVHHRFASDTIILW